MGMQNMLRFMMHINSLLPELKALESIYFAMFCI